MTDQPADAHRVLVLTRRAALFWFGWMFLQGVIIGLCIALLARLP